MTNVTKMIISVFDKVENIVGKGEIACTSNFSFSHNVFKWLLSQTRQISLSENGLKNGKFSKRVENTVEKEKLLVMSNLSFSNSWFSKDYSIAETKRQGFVWKRLITVTSKVTM